MSFSETTLLSGSWIQQVWSDIKPAFNEKRLPKADTLDDSTAMKIGFELYKKYGKFAENLTYQDVLDMLDKTNIGKIPKSKQVHWCYNTDNPNRIKK